MAPDDWSRDLVTRTGFEFAVRPAEPADEAALGAFFTHVVPEDLRFRFLTGITSVGNGVGAVTSIEHGLTENFLAVGKEQSDIIAIATLACDEAMQVGEVAIAIRSDYKSRGISWDFLAHLAACAKAKGLATVQSVESSEHHVAIDMERQPGFVAAPYPGDSTLTIVQRQLQEC